MLRVLEKDRYLTIEVSEPASDGALRDLNQIAETIRAWHPDVPRSLVFRDGKWRHEIAGRFSKPDVRRLGRTIAGLDMGSLNIVTIWLHEDEHAYKRLLRIEITGNQIEIEDGREEGFEDL